MTTLQLNWVILKSGDWCPFETVDLSNVNTIGVYGIWYNGRPGKVVRWGQGVVKDRLTAHRNDRAVLAYRENGLLVTWAAVQTQHLDGVERYLSDTYPPLVGDRFPMVTPIAVNSPWG